MYFMHAATMVMVTQCTGSIPSFWCWTIRHGIICCNQRMAWKVSFLIKAHPYSRDSLPEGGCGKGSRGREGGSRNACSKILVAVSKVYLNTSVCRLYRMTPPGCQSSSVHSAEELTQQQGCLSCWMIVLGSSASVVNGLEAGIRVCTRPAACTCRRGHLCKEEVCNNHGAKAPQQQVVAVFQAALGSEATRRGQNCLCDHDDGHQHWQLRLVHNLHNTCFVSVCSTSDDRK